LQFTIKHQGINFQINAVNKIENLSIENSLRIGN